MHSPSLADATFANGSVDKGSKPRVRLPFDAPVAVLRNSIYVTDPEDIVTEAVKLRRKRLDDVFDRYMTQIQYGCKDPACTTPTCLSCRKRQNKVPLRRYTALSARALAYSMISERYPEAGLCRNELSGPTTPETKSPILKSRRRSGQLRSSEESLNRQANGDVKASGARSRRHSSQLLTSNSGGTGRIGSVQLKSHIQDPDLHDNQTHRASSLPKKPAPSPQKDSKSFTQTLFDTFSLQPLMQWVPFTQASDVDRNSYDENEDSVENRHAADRQSGNSTIRRPSTKYTCFTDATPPASDEKSLSDSTRRLDVKDEQNPPYDDKPRNWSPDFAEQVVDQKATAASERIHPFLEGNQDRIPEPVSAGLNTLDTQTGSTNTSSPEILDQTLDGAIERPSAGDTNPVSSVPTLNCLLPQVCMWINEVSDPKTERQYPEKLSNDLGYASSEEFARALQNARGNPAVDNFISQSLYFCLKTPSLLLESIYSWGDAANCLASDPQTFLLDPVHTIDFWRTLKRARPADSILRHLFQCLQNAYTPPLWLQAMQRRRKIPKARSLEDKADVEPDNLMGSHGLTRLDDTDSAAICAAALYALTWYFYQDWNSSILAAQAEYKTCEASHECFPAPGWERRKLGSARLFPTLAAGTDSFDDMDACRLFERIMDVLSTRLAFQDISQTRKLGHNGINEQNHKTPSDFCYLVLRHLKPPVKNIDQDSPGLMELQPHPTTYSAIHWCRNLISKNWDGAPILRRASPIGGCILFLASMYKNRQYLKLDAQIFYMDPIIASRLNTVDMPVEWLSFRANNNEVHLLSYSFLFKPATLVAYFRAVNFSIMSKSYEAAGAASKFTRYWTLGHAPYIPVYGTNSVLDGVRSQMAQLLVLTVRRDNVLTDAIDQIWRRQRREIMRPLKVVLGKNEGEEGIDVGGVQQEFFGVLLAEALAPVYGMFTIDDRTRMTWFQPTSLEPLYKFEVLGILVSIAVYNCITLPITFPLAFYRKLLGLKVKKLDHISDGWRDLTKGMQEMLDWKEGDVGDVLMRTYEFSYEAFGTLVDIDMEKIGRDDIWPTPERKKGKEKAKTATFEFPPSPEFTPPSDLSPPSSPEIHLDLNNNALVAINGTLTPASVRSDVFETEASTVTNENRAKFVKDYIFWLTDKSIRPQFDAFAKGFYACLDRTALSMFTPEALKTVIEGHTEIDIAGLEKVAKYTEYTAKSPTIEAFWQVVRGFSKEQHAQLLEFVTASDRVPVNGIESVTFNIQRNGEDDKRLPTSVTCFGILLMPEYSSKEVLEEKLKKAIEHSKGFGTG